MSGGGQASTCHRLGIPPGPPPGTQPHRLNAHVGTLGLLHLWDCSQGRKGQHSPPERNFRAAGISVVWGGEVGSHGSSSTSAGAGV